MSIKLRFAYRLTPSRKLAGEDEPRTSVEDMARLLRQLYMANQGCERVPLRGSFLHPEEAFRAWLPCHKGVERATIKFTEQRGGRRVDFTLILKKDYEPSALFVAHGGVK